MHTIRTDLHSVKAFAPATCANVAVGFDILGFSFDTVGDYVTLTRRDDQQMVIEGIECPEHLPLDPDKNTASVVIQHACNALGLNIGFSIHIKKGIPLSSGMGGSAASAVAALVAFNAFLTTPLSHQQLAAYALQGEAVASGQAHGDNVVPCIWGGLTLLRSLAPLEVIALPLPVLSCVLVHPHLHVSTKDARNALSTQLLLKDHVMQSAQLAAFIAALYQDDMHLLKKSLTDIIIEPQRAHFVPHFYEIKQAGLNAGALGVSLSGSGPTLFALAHHHDEATAIGHAMQAAVEKQGIASDCWIAPLRKQGAHVVQTQ